MPENPGLWIKPIVYLVVVFVSAFRSWQLSLAYGKLLPPEERKGALWHDPEVMALIQKEPWRLFTSSFMTRAGQVGMKRQQDPVIERKRQEAKRWGIAAIAVAVLGLPLL